MPTYWGLCLYLLFQTPSAELLIKIHYTT